MKQIISDIRHEIREIQTTPGPIRKFGFILTAILLLISAWLFFKSSPMALPFGILSLICGLLAFLFPMFIKPLYYSLTVVSIFIGYFVSKILLIIMFILFFAPVGLVTRLIKADLLKQKFDKKAASYWVKKEPVENRKQSTELMF